MKEKILQWVQQNKIAVSIQVGVTVCVCLLLSFVLFQSKPVEKEEAKTASIFAQATPKASEPAKESKGSKETAPDEIYVDVKGAVKSPGMYKVTEQMRVQDVIDLAGGFLKTAERKKVNLAQKLTDQMVIYVAKVGEKVSDETAEVATNGAGVESSSEKEGENKEGKINLNTATSEELQKISGVGKKKADEIIAYRENNGSFQSVDDLKNVSGIGEKTVEKIKDDVCV